MFFGWAATSGAAMLTMGRRSCGGSDGEPIGHTGRGRRVRLAHSVGDGRELGGPDRGVGVEAHGQD